jgi:hypothetical protein
MRSLPLSLPVGSGPGAVHPFPQGVILLIFIVGSVSLYFVQHKFACRSAMPRVFIPIGEYSIKIKKIDLSVEKDFTVWIISCDIERNGGTHRCK